MLSDAHEAAVRLASSGAKQRFYTLPQGFSTTTGSRSMLSASTSTPSISRSPPAAGQECLTAIDLLLHRGNAADGMVNGQ